jgi:type IV pilus assembly protein PilA
MLSISYSNIRYAYPLSRLKRIIIIVHKKCVLFNVLYVANDILLSYRRRPMRNNIRSVRGFKLIELMITVTIVEILAAIAVPSYLNYTRRAYYAEIVAATAPYKIGVSECYQNQGSLANCNGGSNHVPANVAAAQGNVTSIAVAAGVITVVPVAANGITAADTYVLTPLIAGTAITWTASGGGVTNGYAG